MSDPTESDVIEPAAPSAADTTAAAAPDAPPAASFVQAADDIDDLLAEYDADGEGAEQQPAEQQQQPPVDPTDSFATLQLARWALATEARLQAEQDHRDGMVAIGAIRGDIPAATYSDEMVAAWVNKVAQEDPKLDVAWQNRARDPRTYQRTVERLSRRFHKEHGQLPDKQTTDDREAVSAAVRGASQRAPEAKAPDFSRMTDNEFAAEKDRMFG